MSLEILSFHVGMLPAAAELLSRRHARDRAMMPLLPARFEQPRMAQAAVREVWSKPHTSGVAAFRDGRMVGYLLGQAKFEMHRGRHVWIPLPGYALGEGEPADLYADLYATIGPEWLRLGAFDHYVMMPAEDRDGLDAWFTLSFGKEQAHAILSLAGTLPEPVAVPGVTIRRATEEDRDAFVDKMSPILRRHLTGAPVWGAALPENVDPMREGFAEMLTDESARTWIAEAEGSANDPDRVLGYQLFYPASPADDNLTVSISERTVLLEVAATRPDARGRGIGRALTAAGLADAAAAGYKVCITDWRTTNIEANRFWPRNGFRPAVYRLVRKVDSRITWATF
jgi:ribosomal protein S18 acetylase RimI-like enzyme